ncbi:MAG: glycosyltransferase family 4 protein [Rhodospirillales bacterium]|nr:glycosyltransferase family 4 protein [Rhodospirillales bacterium]
MPDTFVDLPHVIDCASFTFGLAELSDERAGGWYADKKGRYNRFELLIEHTDGTQTWQSMLGEYVDDAWPAVDALQQVIPCTRFSIVVPADAVNVSFIFPADEQHSFTLEVDRELVPAKAIAPACTPVILFDVSDLIYYIGHHDHLTGIQRVQASILLGLSQVCPSQKRGYITFNTRVGDFEALEPQYFERLLADLSLPQSKRTVVFDKRDAQFGVLPSARPISPESLKLKDDERLVVYLLGAAWVNTDYFHRISDFKRRYGALFAMTIHDLIPVFAKDTCDPDTAAVFDHFLRKSVQHTDHYFAVSEHTAFDFHRFARMNGYTDVPVSVVENAHTFDEFLHSPSKAANRREPYVLFVSTVEGRKNHGYVFDIWAELTKRMSNVPDLICIGRMGWKAEVFLEKMLASKNLNGKIKLLTDVPDSRLDGLYRGCLFTVYPSLYEGWGLPVGESLAKGKLCVLSDRSSLPEVAGEFGIYVDIESVNDGADKIQKLLEDGSYRRDKERQLQEEFRPRTWQQVASNLLAKVSMLLPTRREPFPVVESGKEYKLVQLPPRDLNSLGEEMVAKVVAARRGFITGQINSDGDVLTAQATRFGNSWHVPDKWGTWSAAPRAAKMFYVKTRVCPTEVACYEKMRVGEALVGSVLRVRVNGQHDYWYVLEKEEFLLRFPAPVGNSVDGYCQIDVEYEVLRPGVVSGDVDARSQGLGFESMMAITEEDYRSRLRILEACAWERRLSDLFLDRVEPRVAQFRTRKPNSKTGAPSVAPDVPLSLNKDASADLTTLNRPTVVRTGTPARPRRQTMS